jgi:predicted phage terminase large subunit-like protein
VFDLLDRLADLCDGVAAGESDVPLVFATPGEIAHHIDPRTVQTPALDILDQALVDAANGERPRLIFTMPPQEGKLVDHDELVPTPDGWRRHGDLAVGDKVYHPSGRPIVVVAVHTDGQASMRVETIDGGSVVVHPAHEWTVFDRACGQWRTLETRELAGRKLKSGGRYTIMLPSRGALKGGHVDLPMDPYTLGVWLGDGSTTKGAITHHADDHYDLPYEVSSSQVHPSTGVITDYYVGLKADLRRAGVFGDKHIPDAYLWADAQSRWDLLCGLIDTDGSIDERGQLLFANVNERLAEGVAQLIRSFGYRAGGREISPRTSTSGIVGKRPVFTVTYSPSDGLIPARLGRKRAKIDGTAVPRCIAITSITPVEPRPGRCITVDSPDGLYLVGRHMLPTHNSWRVSRAFPLWLLHRNPDLRIGIVSYAEDLAVAVAGKVRDDLASHHELQVNVSRSTRGKGEWSIEGYQGGVIARGVGGGLTGRPIDVLIIDDPLKDRKEADSEVYRKRAWDWWTEVGSARLGPASIVIVVMTRWHEDDLAGRLMAEEGVKPSSERLAWRLINIPARAEHEEGNSKCKCGGSGALPPCVGREILGREPGAYMVSARGRSQEEWENRERTAGPYAWSALYQGHPSPADGGILKRDWFKIYTDTRAVRRSDGTWMAVGADQVWLSVDASFKDTSASDYVCMQVWGQRGARTWLLDQFWDRADFNRTCRELEFLCAKWTLPNIGGKLIEDKANGPAIIASLSLRVPGMIAVSPTESKEARVHSVVPFIVAGNAEFPDPLTHPWMVGLLDEATSFPNGVHDDQVDAMSQVLRHLFLAAGTSGDQFMQQLLAEQRGGAQDGTQGRASAWTPQHQVA